MSPTDQMIGAATPATVAYTVQVDARPDRNGRVTPSSQDATRSTYRVRRRVVVDDPK